MKEREGSFNNFLFSRAIKKIDLAIGEKRLGKSQKQKNESQDQTQNQPIKVSNTTNNNIKKKCNKRIIKIRELIRKNNSRNNIDILNSLSTPYILPYISTISPFFSKNKNELIIDKEKPENIYARGFKQIWNQEKILKFEKKNEKESGKFSESEEEKNTKRFFILNKDCDKKKENEIFKERIKKVMERNLKVKSKLNLYRKLKKAKKRQTYEPKYDVIEKHTPEVILKNNMKRIFPYSLMKKSYYLGYYNKTSYENKTDNNNIRTMIQNQYNVCSNTSLKNYRYYCSKNI